MPYHPKRSQFYSSPFHFLFFSPSCALSLAHSTTPSSFSSQVPMPQAVVFINPGCNYFCFSLILLTSQLRGSSIRINPNHKKSHFTAFFTAAPVACNFSQIKGLFYLTISPPSHLQSNTPRHENKLDCLPSIYWLPVAARRFLLLCTKWSSVQIFNSSTKLTQVALV